jgi:hypothetical protein
MLFSFSWQRNYRRHHPLRTNGTDKLIMSARLLTAWRMPRLGISGPRQCYADIPSKKNNLADSRSINPYHSGHRAPA